MKTLSGTARCVLSLLLTLGFVLGAAVLRPAAALDAAAIPEFSIEQVYVNVPEMDVFVYALDANGQSYSPTMVRAAGVELKIGDTTIETGNILMANEPICYLLAVDNADTIPPETFAAYKAALRQVVNDKTENDQIALYTTAGGLQCVLPATTDANAVLRAIAFLKQQDARSDWGSAATGIYGDVNQNFASLAPRKVAFAFTDSLQLLSNVALVGGLASNAGGLANMAIYTFVSSENPDRLAFLSSMTSDKMVMCTKEDLRAEVREKQQRLANALEFKTAISESYYGDRLDELTLSVPALGSAVKTSTTVYMGHRLTKPLVESVAVLGRGELELTFNQAVDNADTVRSYTVQSEDIWGWRPAITGVTLSQDGKTARLQTDNLYVGSYSVRLKNVTSRVSAANVSEPGAETLFKVEDWPRDEAFYLARFRVPITVVLALLLLLVVHTVWQREHDRQAEKQAEGEHLLAAASADTSVAALPSRWLTLFVRTRRSIAETRWSALVESSILLGSDPALCDLCIADSRVAAQHCVLAIEGEGVLVRALEGCAVYVNGQRIGDAHHLKNDDIIKLGRTTVRVVV